MSCQTDWSENFKEREKSPFGNYIIHQEASNLFKNQEITLLKENIYDFLIFEGEETKAAKRNYVIIKQLGYKIKNNGIGTLLNFVEEGNTAFLAFNQFNDSLKKALSFTTNNLDKNEFGVFNLKKLSGKFYLKNKNFQETEFEFDRNIRRNYFLQYDENKTSVLGTIEVGGEQVPNFVKINHGKGAFLLHIHPIAFTNYYLLNGKENYTENVFSYLPEASILWDPMIKSSKYTPKQEDNNSVFKFFLEHETLTWFLWVSLAGVLLFMLFNARRKQRAIPVIKPLQNSTVAFTQTIANLYLKEQNHKNLIDKKIAFFLEKVRTKYLLNTSNLNKDFIEKLAQKSGNEIQRTKYLVHSIIALNKKEDCTEEDLIVLHKMIENFLNT